MRSTQPATPGSGSPQRVPITRPSSGVSPINVSTERPRSTVRKPVEPVAPHAGLPPRLRNRVAGGRLRHGTVERGIEDGDLRHSGPEPRCAPQGTERQQVVLRRQRKQPLDLAIERAGVARRLRVPVAAVHHTLPDGVDPGMGGRHLLLHLLQRLLHARGAPQVPSMRTSPCTENTANFRLALPKFRHRICMGRWSGCSYGEVERRSLGLRLTWLKRHLGRPACNRRQCRSTTEKA